EPSWPDAPWVCASRSRGSRRDRDLSPRPRIDKSEFVHRGGHLVAPFWFGRRVRHWPHGTARDSYRADDDSWRLGTRGPPSLCHLLWRGSDGKNRSGAASWMVSADFHRRRSDDSCRSLAFHRTSIFRLRACAVECHLWRAAHPHESRNAWQAFARACVHVDPHGVVACGSNAGRFSAAPSSRTLCAPIPKSE